MTEKIRQLANKVTLAGSLVELKRVREGVTKTGIPYLSFEGAIQCGDSPVYRVRFKTFVKSKKNDGTDSVNFVKVKEWLASAVAMYENELNPSQVSEIKPTMVTAIGSLADNPYVNKEGKLVEGIEYNVQFFSDFEAYKADIDIEGFIHSIVEETKGEDKVATGRQKMRLISRDIFGNMLDFKSIIIPTELVGPISENGYERGCTSKFYLALKPNQNVASNSNGGIGTQRMEGGKSYLEWVMTGAAAPYSLDSEQALDAELVKQAMNERQANLKTISDAGYRGTKANSAPAFSSNTQASVAAPTSTFKADDDSFPF